MSENYLAALMFRRQADNEGAKHLWCLRRILMWKGKRAFLVEEEFAAFGSNCFSRFQYTQPLCHLFDYITDRLFPVPVLRLKLIRI